MADGFWRQETRIARLLYTGLADFLTDVAISYGIRLFGDVGGLVCIPRIFNNDIYCHLSKNILKTDLYSLLIYYMHTK